MFTFLLVIQAIVAALLVTVILMQRSEGGGLTSGGSPSGLMSARGAADFLTRATSILAALFIGMSILLAVLAAARHSTSVDTSLQRQPAPATAPLPSAPADAVPFAAPGNGAAGVPNAIAAPSNAAAPANGSVPLAR
ncbi:MAG: preprotein translocase subunit SecG [Sphingomonas sp.]